MRAASCIFAVALLGAASSTLLASQDVLTNHIQKGAFTIDLEPVATGFASPVGLMQAPGDPSKTYIVDQTGQIRVLQNGVLQSTPFLDISSKLIGLSASYDERGLLGLAFDPNFATNGKFYTYESEPVNGAGDFTLYGGVAPTYQNVLAAWTVNLATGQVNASSYTPLMRIDKNAGNHNGGTIAFGPDGKLYIGLGDGGNANDSGPGHNPSTGNAQDLTTPLGKMLRIDVGVTPGQGNSANGKYNIPSDNPFVNTAGALKETWALGLRNPYRFSFDSANGALIAGDVGQNTVEEVDQVVKGANYGWPVKEGTFLFNRTGGSAGTVNPTNSPGSPAGYADPLLEYDHVDGTAVIGGFVYHGSLMPQLDGKYIFGDLNQVISGNNAPNARLFYADLSTGQISEFHYGALDLPLGFYLKGFGEDANGEIYALTSTNYGPSGSTGEVFLIVPEPAGLALFLLLVPLLARPRRIALPAD